MSNPLNIQLYLAISPEEAQAGCTKAVDYNVWQGCAGCGGSGSQDGAPPAVPCPKCGGSGQTKKKLFAPKQCNRCRGTGFVSDQPCLHCGGRGRVVVPRVLQVTVPPGSEHGQQLCYAGQGNHRDWRTDGAGQPGDLLLTVNLGQQTPGFADLQDVFESFFGGGIGVGPGASTPPPPKVELLQLSAREFQAGCVKELTYKPLLPCQACGGTRGTVQDGPSCTACGGSGRVSSTSRTPFGQVRSVKVCTTCGGQGRGRFIPCAVCRGIGGIRQSRRIQVTVPPGVTSLQLDQQGDYHAPTQSFSPLTVQIQVR